MQFVVIAYDYKAGGLERRLAVRKEHIACGDRMKEAGNYLMGGALLDEKNVMIGSVMILDFPSRAELDSWLKIEPYMIHKVWEKVTVSSYQVGPMFLK